MGSCRLSDILTTKIVASFAPAHWFVWATRSIAATQIPYEYLCYITQEFRTEHRCALLQILIQNYLKDLEFLPDYVSQAAMSYMADSCDIITWFMDTFEMVDDDKEAISFGVDIFEEQK